MNLMMVLREGGIWKHQSATLGLSWPTVTIVAIVASHQAHSWPVASALTAGGLSTMHSTPRWKEEVFAMLLSLDIRLVMTIHPHRLLIGDVYSSDFGYYYSHPLIRRRWWFLPTTRKVIFQTENSMIVSLITLTSMNRGLCFIGGENICFIRRRFKRRVHKPGRWRIGHKNVCNYWSCSSLSDCQLEENMKLFW